MSRANVDRGDDQDAVVSSTCRCLVQLSRAHSRRDGFYQLRRKPDNAEGVATRSCVCSQVDVPYRRVLRAYNEHARQEACQLYVAPSGYACAHQA